MIYSWVTWYAIITFPFLWNFFAFTGANNHFFLMVSLVFKVLLTNSFWSCLIDPKISSECVHNTNNSLFHFLPGEIPPGAIWPLLASEFVGFSSLLHCSCHAYWNSLPISPELYSVFLRSQVSLFFCLFSWYMPSGNGAREVEFWIPCTPENAFFVDLTLDG